MAVVSTLEKLPVELKQRLLSAMPDVLSLRSAALSCSSLLDAFLGAEELVTTQVVKNQFDLLPEAAVAYKSSRLPAVSRPKPCTPLTMGDFQAFVNDDFHSKTSSPDSWTLNEALPLGRLHFTVERFTSEFITETLNESSAFAYIDAPPGWPVSRHELNRIQRTFYRFEAYCNLFCNTELLGYSKPFFNKFSFWENEQLACVHDYLFRALCPAFNDVVENDLELGSDSICPVDVVEYGDDFDSPYVEEPLGRGLEFIRQAVDADTREARPRLVGPKNRSTYFLYAALREGPSGHDDGDRLSEYTREEEEQIYRACAPFVPDPNDGPADAWRWAHQEETSHDFVNSIGQVALRSRGYCMWDRARLDRWSVFQRPWDPPDNPHQRNEQRSRKAELQMWYERNRSPL